MERILLADTVTQDDLDDVRLKHGFRLANVIAARSGIPAQQVLLTSDRRHLLQVVDDTQLGVRYVVVTGPQEVETRTVVEAALPTIGGAEVDRMLDQGEPRALGLAALMHPTARPHVLQAFDRAFIDRRDAVRTFALVASAYARWPELRSRVSRVAGTDPGEAIRERALLILDAWP